MNKIFDAPTHEAKDFKTVVEFEKWARENFKKPPLSTKEQSVLKDYENTQKGWKSLIDDYLKETDGKLIDKNDPNYKLMIVKYGFDIGRLNQRIEDIDKIIDKVKIPESIFIHERVDETRLGIEENSLRDANGKISSSKLGKSVKEYLGEKLVKVNYLTGDLVKNQNSDQLSVLFRYRIPKGTHGAYFYSSQYAEPKILIGRNQNFHIQRMSIINEKNKQTLLVEANLT